VVANKADTTGKAQMASEFYALGLGEVYSISSANGSGTGDLLDEVVKTFQADAGGDDEEGLPRIAIIGRPNVGKSSFLNVLVGEERSIVTDIAGTTRDAIDTRYKLYGRDFILTDTAGVRRRSRVKENIEFYSTMRAIKALQESDVCIILIDAALGLESQDLSLIALAVRYKKGIVVMVNKWDLIVKDHKTADRYKKEILEKLGPHSYVPVLFTSVVKKQRVFRVVETAMQVYENRRRKVATSALNDTLLPAIQKHPPPAVKGKHIKIKYTTQLPSNTPAFAFFCNFPKYIKAPYARFIENRIRESFDFTGVPIRIFFRNK
jgi:GTP-binding protein